MFLARLFSTSAMPHSLNYIVMTSLPCTWTLGDTIVCDPCETVLNFVSLCISLPSCQCVYYLSYYYAAKRYIVGSIHNREETRAHYIHLYR